MGKRDPDLDTYADQKFKIIDRKGRVVEALNGRIEKIEFVKMGKRLPTAIHVLRQEEYAGHYGYTDYLFTRQGGVRCVLMFEGGDFGIKSYDDLNGDGRKEILANSAALAYDGYSFAMSPAVLVIFGWNGRHYVNRSLRFAWRVRLAACDYQRTVERITRNTNRQSSQYRGSDQEMWDEDALHGAIAGYFGEFV